MKNTFGSSVCVTLFGESHGARIGAVLDGIAPGIPVDEDLIRHQLTLRRPAGSARPGRSRMYLKSSAACLKAGQPARP